MAALGTGAQAIAAYATSAPPWQALAIGAASVTWLLRLLGLAQAGNTGRPAVAATVCTFMTVTVGLLYLNGGYDGTHLYPALWIFSVVGIVGLYGSWLLTGLTMGEPPRVSRRLQPVRGRSHDAEDSQAVLARAA